MGFWKCPLVLICIFETAHFVSPKKSVSSGHLPPLVLDKTSQGTERVPCALLATHQQRDSGPVHSAWMRPMQYLHCAYRLATNLLSTILPVVGTLESSCQWGSGKQVIKLRDIVRKQNVLTSYRACYLSNSPFVNQTFPTFVAETFPNWFHFHLISWQYLQIHGPDLYETDRHIYAQWMIYQVLRANLNEFVKVMFQQVFSGTGPPPFRKKCFYPVCSDFYSLLHKLFSSPIIMCVLQ